MFWGNLKIYLFLFDIQNQSFQIFPFRMVDIDRMISRLCQLMQDAYTTAGLGGSTEYSQAEILFADNLRTGEGKQDTSRFDLFESDCIQFAVSLQSIT